MSRYVETDTLKEQMLKYGFHSADQTVTEFVEDTLPTADVVPMDYHEKCLTIEIQKRANMVEVVKCKYCKHFHDGIYNEEYWMECDEYKIALSSDEWFCADGKRREDEI